MRIFKIKDWLKRNEKQFKIFSEETDNSTKSALRFKDNMIFFQEVLYFFKFKGDKILHGKLAEFLTDEIHVVMRFKKDINSDEEYVTLIEINSILSVEEQILEIHGVNLREALKEND